jgi:hypothetical protein
VGSKQRLELLGCLPIVDLVVPERIVGIETDDEVRRAFNRVQ